jgi:hypothetical protein
MKWQYFFGCILGAASLAVWPEISLHTGAEVGEAAVTNLAGEVEDTLLPVGGEKYATRKSFNLSAEGSPKCMMPTRPPVRLGQEKGSASCDNCRDDGTDLGTRSVQGTAL